MSSSNHAGEKKLKDNDHPCYQCRAYIENTNLKLTSSSNFLKLDYAALYILNILFYFKAVIQSH